MNPVRSRATSAAFSALKCWQRDEDRLAGIQIRWAHGHLGRPGVRHRARQCMQVERRTSGDSVAEVARVAVVAAAEPKRIANAQHLVENVLAERLDKIASLSKEREADQALVACDVENGLPHGWQLERIPKENNMSSLIRTKEIFVAVEDQSEDSSRTHAILVDKERRTPQVKIVLCQASVGCTELLELFHFSSQLRRGLDGHTTGM